MKPIYLSIQQQATGNRIRELLKENGYTVKDIQEAMGFENPQAVYKWISGRSLPSIDNFLILSKVLHTSIEDILVIDGDIVIFCCFSISRSMVGEVAEVLKSNDVIKADLFCY